MIQKPLRSFPKALLRFVTGPKVSEKPCCGVAAKTVAVHKITPIERITEVFFNFVTKAEIFFGPHVLYNSFLFCSHNQNARAFYMLQRLLSLMK
jgi:hypothetical protein